MADTFWLVGVGRGHLSQVKADTAWREFGPAGQIRQGAVLHGSIGLCLLRSGSAGQDMADRARPNQWWYGSIGLGMAVKEIKMNYSKEEVDKMLQKYNGEVYHKSKNWAVIIFKFPEGFIIAQDCMYCYDIYISGQQSMHRKMPIEKLVDVVGTMSKCGRLLTERQLVFWLRFKVV